MLGLLSNENLPRGINWSLLSDPLFAELCKVAPCGVLAPHPATIASPGEYLRLAARARKATALFSMHGRARPYWPLQIVTWMARRVPRAVFYVDPWRPALDNIRFADKVLRHDVCFIPYREAFDLLSSGPGGHRYRYLPFAADLESFRDYGSKRDIDILWMGRRYEPLHAAILAMSSELDLVYCHRDNLGFIEDPKEMGRLAARARYFVVTPPDLDNVQRTGGFSPLVMRYLEGLAAGSRLLGVLPRSGEFEAILPRESILEVKPDGSDLVQKFQHDKRDRSGLAATRQAAEMVRQHHGWNARARDILLALAELPAAVPPAQRGGSSVRHGRDMEGQA